MYEVVPDNAIIARKSALRFTGVIAGMHLLGTRICESENVKGNLFALLHNISFWPIITSFLPS